MKDLREKIQELEKELAELRARLPKHSVPPSMIMREMELEDELERLKEQLKHKEENK